MTESTKLTGCQLAGRGWLADHTRHGIRTMKKVLVLGHSHVNIIEAGLPESKKCNNIGSRSSGEADLEEVNFSFVQLHGYNPLFQAGQIVPSLQEAISAATIPGRTLTAFSVRGAAHTKFGLPEDPATPIRFAGHPEDHRRIVPRGLFRAAIALELDWAFQELVAMLRFVTGPKVFIAHPPPVSDLTFLKLNAGWLQPIVDEHGTCSSELQFEVWRMQDDMFRAKCAELELPYLEVPPEALDSEGFRKIEYTRPDPTHGNVEYGALVIKQLEKLARQ